MRRQGQGTSITKRVGPEVEVLQGCDSGQMGPQCTHTLDSYVIVAQIQILQAAEAGEMGCQCSCTLVTNAAAIQVGIAGG